MQKKHQQAGATAPPLVIKVKSLAALNQYQTSSKATSSLAKKRVEPRPDSSKPIQKSNKLLRYVSQEQRFPDRDKKLLDYNSLQLAGSGQKNTVQSKSKVAHRYQYNAGSRSNNATNM